MKNQVSKMRRIRRRIKRFFNSPRGRKLLIGSLALGIGIAVAYNPFTRQIVIGYWSRLNNLFNSLNEENTASIPLEEMSSESNSLTWKQIGLFGGIVIVILGVGLWSGKIELGDFNFFSRKEEVVTVPSKSYDPSSWDSYPLPSGRPGLLVVVRILTGTTLLILSGPIGIALNSPAASIGIGLTGYQMVTWQIK